MADVGLLVNGREYRGWMSVRISRGIETGAGGFDLSVTDRWAVNAEAWPIREEDECVVTVDKQPLITGYVDKRALSLEAASHSFSVSGRDKVGTLVDCSAILDQWEFKNFDILKLARKVADPFGVKVSLQPGVAIGAPSEKLCVDPGERAFDVIEKACRLVGLLPVSDGKGGLLLTQAGTAYATTAIVEGQNLLAGSSDFDASGRYRTYLVVGQHTGKKNRKIGVQIKGTAEDLDVKRADRTLVVRPEHACNSTQAAKRAQWEASVRAARGDSLSVSVQGWTQKSGAVWPVNARVVVDTPSLGVRGSMLITATEFSLDDSGETTRLSLKRPDAFIAQPRIPKGGGNNYWKEIKRGV